jgi:hypothetical protein
VGRAPRARQNATTRNAPRARGCDASNRAAGAALLLSVRLARAGKRERAAVRYRAPVPSEAEQKPSRTEARRKRHHKGGAFRSRSGSGSCRLMFLFFFLRSSHVHLPTSEQNSPWAENQKAPAIAIAVCASETRLKASLSSPKRMASNHRQRSWPWSRKRVKLHYQSRAAANSTFEATIDAWTEFEHLSRALTRSDTHPGASGGLTRTQLLDPLPRK